MKKKIDKVMEIIYDDSNYKEIKEVDRDLDDSIISIIFTNDASIIRADAEKMIDEYKRIEKMIDEYIECNNLDDYNDYNIIVAHFNDFKEYFENEQAAIIEFERYINRVRRNKRKELK